jgi:hypothetical protein
MENQNTNLDVNTTHTSHGSILENCNPVDAYYRFGEIIVSLFYSEDRGSTRTFL